MLTYCTESIALGRLSDIRSGLTARQGLTEAQDGVAAIPLREIPMEGCYAIRNAPRFALEGSFDRYRVCHGDVLFRSRGDRNTAVLAEGDEGDEAIALLPLLIIRVDRSRLSPAYLAWFLNQRPAQRHFDGCARGTNMRMIPRDCLASLPVPLPPLERQELIAETASLAARERSLLHALADKRAALIRIALLPESPDTSLKDEAAPLVDKSQKTLGRSKLDTQNKEKDKKQ